jgi:hypothetical protein
MQNRVLWAAMAATGVLAASAVAQPGKEKDRPRGTQPTTPSTPAQPATPRPGDRQPATPATPAQPGGKPSDQQGKPSQEEMEKAWMAAASPGENHKLLEGMIGEWDTTARFWMEPGGEPSEGKGTSKNEWALGGRFVKQSFKGNFMGMEFEGLGYTGYDNVRKKYIGSWMDNMSTGMMTSEGEYDAAARQFNFTGAFTDPFGREIKSRETLKIESPDRVVFTMYHTEPGGQEQKVGEITYNRVGGAGAPAHSDRPIDRPRGGAPSTPSTPRPNTPPPPPPAPAPRGGGQ